MSVRARAGALGEGRGEGEGRGCRGLRSGMGDPTVGGEGGARCDGEVWALGDVVLREEGHVVVLEPVRLWGWIGEGAWVVLPRVGEVRVEWVVEHR